MIKTSTLILNSSQALTLPHSPATISFKMNNLNDNMSTNNLPSMDYLRDHPHGLPTMTSSSSGGHHSYYARRIPGTTSAERAMRISRAHDGEAWAHGTLGDMAAPSSSFRSPLPPSDNISVESYNSHASPRYTAVIDSHDDGESDHGRPNKESSSSSASTLPPNGLKSSMTDPRGGTWPAHNVYNVNVSFGDNKPSDVHIHTRRSEGDRVRDTEDMTDNESRAPVRVVSRHKRAAVRPADADPAPRTSTSASPTMSLYETLIMLLLWLSFKFSSCTCSALGVPSVNKATVVS